MLKQILIQCASLVARDAVKRVNIDGVEHIVISSMTLPDDIVMNGGLYPADEIAKSYLGLNRTLAPVEHPTDAEGNYISASDPAAIHNFYAGAYNDNARRENGRVSVDKVINVAEARKTDRGKRLLDRVAEIESNPEARPIHTSVGVWVDVEQLNQPQTNAKGDQFTWIARNMTFDHDAILLDSVGAAQPHQGVGMAVNRDGVEFEVQRHVINARPSKPKNNQTSVDTLRDALHDAISRDPTGSLAEWHYIEDIYPDEGRVIFSLDGNLFEAAYTLDESGRATIVSVPLPVKREVTYKPRTNRKGDAMKELMLKALADAGIAVNADISDADLLAKYNELLAKQNNQGGGADNGAGAVDATVAAVNKALEPVMGKLTSLEQKVNQRDNEELERLANIVGNSDKYPGVDVEAAKKLGVETLKGMVANCQKSHGLPLTTNDGNQVGESHKYGMPGSKQQQAAS